MIREVTGLLKEKYLMFVLVSGALAKSFLMTLSAMSPDLIHAVDQTLAGAIQGRTPYGFFIRMVVAFWGFIPVDHPFIPSAWTVDTFQASIGLYLLVFLLKLPLLILDMLTAFLIYRIVLNSGLSKWKAVVAFSLWFLNPYVLITNEMWGAVDLLPTFLLLLALTPSRTKKGNMIGVASYAGAIAAKLLPVILLPLFLSVSKLRSRVSISYLTSGLAGTAVYFWWVSSAGYNPWLQLKQYDLFTQYFDEYVISTPSGVGVGLATIAVILTYVLIAERWPRDRTATFDGVLLILIVFFAFSSWFPQTLVWLIPFLVLDMIVGKRSPVYLVVLLSSAFFFSAVAFYPYFTANGYAFFFIPANNHTLAGAVAAYEAFARSDLSVLLGGPLSRAIFSATCILYAIKLIEKRTGVISELVGRLRTPRSGGDS